MLARPVSWISARGDRSERATSPTRLALLTGTRTSTDERGGTREIHACSPGIVVIRQRRWVKERDSSYELAVVLARPAYGAQRGRWVKERDPSYELAQCLRFCHQSAALRPNQSIAAMEFSRLRYNHKTVVVSTVAQV